jgi:hypothetical protein
MKKWYKSKVVWFNIIMAAMVALEASFSSLQPVLPVNVYGVLITVLAVGNAVLRVISTQGFFIKKEK